MKTRTRERGTGMHVSYKRSVPIRLNTTATVSFSHQKKPKNPVQVSAENDLHLPLAGVLVKASEFTMQPDWLLNEYVLPPHYYAVIPDSFLRKMEALIKPRITTVIWEAQMGGTHKFLESDDSEHMTDVIGSGFTANQGKEFIVNPCNSYKRAFELGTSVSNGWKTDVICTRGDAGLSGFNINVRIVLTPTGFTVGLPLGIAEQIQSDLQSFSLSSGESTFQTAYSRVQEGEAEALTMLAEANKTISYVTSRLQNAAEILVKAKRAVFKLDTKAAADLWLEARYAVRPIIYDVNNTVNALKKNTLPKVQTFRASSSEESSFSRTYSQKLGGVTYEVTAETVLVERHTAGVYTRLKLDLPRVHSFGLTNFAQTAWELIPFSFIVDWFVNVSGFLASINPSPVYSIENGFLATKRVAVAQCTLKVTRGEESTSEHFVYQMNTYSRNRVKTPSFFNFDLNLSVPKLVDLLALAKKLL